MSKEKPLILLVLSITFSLLSLVLLVMGMIELQSKMNTHPTLDYLVSGILCLVISFIFAYQHKRFMRLRMTSKYFSITVIKCSNENCTFREEREFKRGDYVFKEVGVCPKCKGKLIIASIYAKPLRK